VVSRYLELARGTDYFVSARGIEAISSFHSSCRYVSVNVVEIT